MDEFLFDEEECQVCAGSDAEDYFPEDAQSHSSTVMNLGGAGRTPKSGTTGGETPRTPSAKQKPKKDPVEKKKCKICKKWFCLTEFPLNSSYCVEDKRTIDCLYKQAAAQGKSEWFAEVRQDPDRLAALVMKYEERCPKLGPKAKRGTFNLVTFIEEFEATSQVKNAADGKLMWWGEYLHFARKPKGGPGWGCRDVECLWAS